MQLRLKTIVIALCVLLPSILWAGSTDFETLSPVVSPENAVQVQSARPTKKLLNTGALLQYEHNPVILYDKNGNRLNGGIGTRIQFRGFFSMLFFERLMVGLDIPITLFDAPNESIAAYSQTRGAKLNGILLHGRYSVFLRPDWAVAATTSLRLPTGSANNLAGFDGRWFEWSLGGAAEWSPSWGFVRGNVVYEEREETQNAALGIFKNDELGLRFAGGYHLPREWTAFAELDTKIGIGGSNASPFNTSGQLILGAHKSSGQWVYGPAVGLGLGRAYGVPVLRLMWATWWHTNLKRVQPEDYQVSTLSIKALDNWRPVGGLRFHIEGYGRSISTVSDTRGESHIPLIPGQYTVRMENSHDYAFGATTITIQAENSYQVVAHLHRIARNAVRVVDAISGAPVAAVSAVVDGVTNPTTVGPAAYQLAATSGTVTVHAQAPGYVSASQDFAADNTALTFPLQPTPIASWRIYVSDKSDPVSQATVTVRQGAWLQFERETDSTGQIAFLLSRAGASASIQHPRYLTATASIDVTVPGEYETAVELAPLVASAPAISSLQRIVLHILDENLNQPVENGTVSLQHSQHTDKFTAGYWAYITDSADTFVAAITAEGYHPASITLSATTPVTEVYLRNRAMDAVSVQKDRLEISEKVMFNTGSAVVALRSYLLLDAVAATLKQASGIAQVKIIGHTDSIGRRSSNIRLSRQRAEAVRNYLLEKGLDPDTLVAEGRGPDEPIADNDTADGREKNRRVEFLIVEQEERGR